IVLGGPKRRQRPRPERPESRAERYARKHAPQGSARTGAAVARAGAAALGAATSDTLQKHERTVGAMIGAGVLGISLLVGRFPRLLAWPLAVFGSLFGGISLVRALRPVEPDPEPVGRRPARRLRLPGRRFPRARRQRRRASDTDLEKRVERASKRQREFK